jgi:hypothetical protein
LIGQGDSHSTPLEIVGASEILNHLINETLMSNQAELISEIVDIKFKGGPTDLCKQYLHTKCRVEIVVLPCDSEINNYLEERNGEPDLNGDEVHKFDEKRGQIDFFNDKDRWQLLSRELA